MPAKTLQRKSAKTLQRNVLQWQNMAESSIKSIMLLAKPEMAESGLAGRFWYRATDFGRACGNATYKQLLGTTPHAKIFGVKKDVVKFRPFARPTCT